MIIHIDTEIKVKKIIQIVYYLEQFLTLPLI